MTEISKCSDISPPCGTFIFLANTQSHSKKIKEPHYLNTLIKKTSKNKYHEKESNYPATFHYGKFSKNNKSSNQY